MNWLWIAEFAVRIYFIVHALRTGRTMWAFILFFVPGIGPLLYLFLEYLPEINRSPATRILGSGLLSKLNPGGSVKRLREELDVADTFTNRIALAHALISAGEFTEAIELYERSLTGQYADDPEALGGLCQACFAKGDYEKAAESLDRLASVKQNRPTLEYDLLYARTLEHLGRDDDALQAYETLVPVMTGEETRVRYGLLLAKLGRTDEARAQFQETVRKARHSPAYYRRSEGHWIRQARTTLRKLT